MSHGELLRYSIKAFGDLGLALVTFLARNESSFYFSCGIPYRTETGFYAGTPLPLSLVSL